MEADINLLTMAVVNVVRSHRPFTNQSPCKMNILPKKSWHVLSKDNIQRVRQDEAAAKAEEGEKERRAALAEREAQLSFMRKRAREKEGLSDVPPASVSSQQADGHVNFFSDIQQGVGVQLSNKDHEQEAKSERETYEKKIGLLNYLVDKTKSDDPWYVTKKKTEESAKSNRKKQLMDPMNDMKHYLGTKRKCTDESSSRPTPQKRPSQSTVERDSQSAHKKSKLKDEKSGKLKDEKSGKLKDEKLEKLRRERLRREDAERLKSDTVLKQHYGIIQENSKSGDVGEEQVRPRKYNSQFNPSLARY